MASRRLRLAHITSDSDCRPSAIDWSICSLCQKPSDENLICPATNPAESLVGAGYRTLARNLLEFQNLGAVPHGLDLQKLNDGDGIECTFVKNKAKWHKQCALNFNTTKLDRAKKRKRSSSLPYTSYENSVQTPSEPNEKKTRSGGRTTLSIKMKMKYFSYAITRAVFENHYVRLLLCKTKKLRDVQKLPITLSLKRSSRVVI